MGRTGHSATGQDSLELASCLQSLQFEAAPELQVSCALGGQPESDSQTLAALGATSVDHSTAATGLHANQETVRAGAFDLGGLVSAFHYGNPKELNDGSPPLIGVSRCLVSPNTIRGTDDYRKFSQRRQHLTLHTACHTGSVGGFFRLVDKFWINYNSGRCNL
jgi:hypothetical protein